MVFVGLVLALGGCSSVPGRTIAVPASAQAVPQLAGSYHLVQRGETLWRIARDYGLTAQQVAAVNRLPNAARLHTGQRLFIPLPTESARFLWPLRGSVRSSGGVALDISAASGSLVRASRGGAVAIAAARIPGLGKTLILDHRDGYLSIYGGLDQLLVGPNMAVRQGVPIGTIGAGSLHFEIRYQTKPKNALALLPRD
ncbi:MAG: peptidoglycan DD-metalloendopeptidase family protein [Candidatus Omnitrophica bacterium]|nr:peptidoglycan DD-metalloendopeptidase family protein [Candidatus Omnitrophota bacterium]